MANEIERKFIVHQNDIPWDTQTHNVYISQGYFPFFKSCRIRKTYSVSNKCELTFKLKTSDPLVRKEYNIKIPIFLFNWFYNYNLIPKMKRVEKRRTFLSSGEEINEYMIHRHYLLSMEMEFSSLEEAEAYTPPFPVILEITNLNWAKDPYLGNTPKEEIWDRILKETGFDGKSKKTW